MDKITFSRADRSREVTTTSINVQDITSLNFDDTVTISANLEAAFNGICDAASHRIQLGAGVVKLAKALAGFREQKWLVRYRETASPFGEYSFEVGTASAAAPTIVETSGKEILDPNSAEWSALSVAVNAGVLSPAGNAVTMYEVELVGRNI